MGAEEACNRTGSNPPDTTRLLALVSAGDAAAANALLPLVYDQLRDLARGYFRSAARDQTLQPTALVHEAYLKLVRSPSGAWKDRVHFLAVAATAMRQILCDRARQRRAAKRGGDAERVPLEQVQTPSGDSPVDVESLDRALERLTALAPRRARIVELRYFGGLTIEETAEALGVSRATVENDWRVARAWLRRELGKGTTA